MKYYLLIIFSCINFFVSAQSGITWGMMGMDIANSSHSNMHPRITLDAARNPLVIWGRMSEEAVLFSRWNGTAFTAPVALNMGGMTVATASWMGPDIASKGDTVYVVWRQTPESMDTSKHIFIVRSFDGGISFSAPVRVDNIGDSVSRFPTVSVDATGNPVVAFMKFNMAFGASRWVVAKSTDYGNSFSIDTKASGWDGSTDVCDCCPGALVLSGNTSAMLYRNNNNNIRDIWTGISTSSSTSFSSGFNVDNHNWNLNSCPSSGPDGVIIGDTLYSVFMNGANVNYRTYLSKSSLSGGAVNSVSNLTGAITGLTQQNYPRIATDGNAMAIVWKQTVSGVAQLPILFTNNIANGFAAMYDTVDLNNITNADVAISNGKIFVVWQDDNSGTVKYRTGTYTQSPQFGSVQATILPAGAVLAGATWNVDGGAAQSSGSIVGNLSLGSHTVNFSTVSGWTTPSTQTVTVTANNTSVITGTYTQNAQYGAIQVTITPAAAVTAGVTWNVDGGAAQTSGSTVGNVAVGSHTINYNAVSGWIAPASQVVTVTSNNTATANGTFTPEITGLREVTKNNFSVYPNPANDFINITSTNNESFSMDIFNSLGEKIYSKETTAYYQVSTANWLSGIYYINIKSDSHFFTQKIIVQ